MNVWQMKALMEWYKMLQASAKEEQEAEFDRQLELEDAATPMGRLDAENPYVDQSILEYRAMGDWQKFLQTPLGERFTERKNRGMSFDKNMALSRKEIERSEQLERDYGHLIPKETEIGRLSALERSDAKIRERVLKDRAEWEAGRAFNLPYEQERDRRYEVEGQPHLLQEQLVSELAKADEPLPRTGKELEVRPPQAPVTRHPGTLSSYSIPERGIEAPDIHVDPSGEARIMSDYYDSIVNYRKSKTGEAAKYMESFDPAEQARRLEGVEQAIPDRGLPENVPEWALIQQEQMKAERSQASEANKKRVERLRAAQAGKTSKFDELVRRYRRAAGKRLRELKRKGHSRSGRMGGGYLPADLAGNLKDSTMQSMILGHRRKPWN